MKHETKNYMKCVNKHCTFYQGANSLEETHCSECNQPLELTDSMKDGLFQYDNSSIQQYSRGK